jgi:predicted DNA-binding WGR domain protein
MATFRKIPKSRASNVRATDRERPEKGNEMEDDKKTFSLYLECKNGLHNKFYEVSARETADGLGEWSFRWGRIGSAGQSKSGSNSSFDAAVRTCQEQARIKRSNGYSEVTPLEALASSAETPEERPNRGLPAISVVVPQWNSGSPKLDAKLTKIAETAISKINIIRASQSALSYREFENQLNRVLEQLEKAYEKLERIDHVERTFYNFFNDLRISAPGHTQLYLRYPTKLLVRLHNYSSTG